MWGLIYALRDLNQHIESFSIFASGGAAEKGEPQEISACMKMRIKAEILTSRTIV